MELILLPIAIIFLCIKFYFVVTCFLAICTGIGYVLSKLYSFFSLMTPIPKKKAIVTASELATYVLKNDLPSNYITNLYITDKDKYEELLETIRSQRTKKN